MKIGPVGGTLVTIKDPASVQVGLNDVDGESYRNANGKMIRDRIATKRKLECKWTQLTTAEISTLLTAVSAVFFDIEYLDPQTGANARKTFYVGDRTAPVYSYALGKWKELSMNFIEQ